MTKQILVVGAGLTGATIARTLADAGRQVTVIDERPHVAGNCHTERHPDTGVMVHKYGPHIFHTSDSVVWEFVRRFAQMQPYGLRVKTSVRGRIYSLPINLATINQFYDTNWSPRLAREMVEKMQDHTGDPQTFEGLALATVGHDLYDAFFRPYTLKMWGRCPSTLPASVFGRLPIRFNYDDRYFNDEFQAIPAGGYTLMVAQMLGHQLITVRPATLYDDRMKETFRHVFYGGPLDRYFGYRHGYLPYRSLKFETREYDGDHQGTAIINNPFHPTVTRAVEHNHLAPWEDHRRSVVTIETPFECRPGDQPFYPVRLHDTQPLLSRYEELAIAEPGVTFVGRLGTYRYLNMDQAVRQALDASELYLKSK